MRGKAGKFTIDAWVEMLERAGQHMTVQVRHLSDFDNVDNAYKEYSLEE